MFSLIWHTFFLNPIYNGLVFFIDTIPGGDVGLAIIAITIVVKIILLPLSFKTARSQQAMREIEPELKSLQEKYKDKREELGRAMMDLYKKAGINPFSPILLLFIQLPIVIALYFSVSKGGGVSLPEINTTLLYSFVPTPEHVSMMFFGLLDITQKSLPLAAIAGITQFIHTSLALPKQKPREKDAEPNFKDDLARSMNLQMRYVMPVMVFIIAYTISAAIALYFTISNIASIAQEYAVKRSHTPKKE